MRSLIWVSKDGRRTATEVFHTKLQRQFIQIQKLSASEDEYLQVLNTFSKNFSSNSSGNIININNGNQSENLLVRLYMFASDLIVGSSSNLNSSKNKKYKLLFLVDYFMIDLKQYLENRKADRNSFSIRELVCAFKEVASSVQLAFEQATMDISRVSVDNFVLNMPHPTLFPSFKFIHIPQLAILENDTINNISNSSNSSNPNSNFSNLYPSKHGYSSSGTSSPLSYSPSSKALTSSGNPKNSLKSSLFSNNPLTQSKQTNPPTVSSQLSSFHSNVLANAASNSLSSYPNKRASLLQTSTYSPHTIVSRPLAHSTHMSSYQTFVSKPEDSPHSMTSNPFQQAAQLKSMFSPAERRMQLEQKAVKDMGEVFVRIATQSIEQWESEEEDSLTFNSSSSTSSGGCSTKLRKGIRQISIKYSPNLGNLVQSMTSSNQNERPQLSSICDILSSLEEESSMQMLDKMNAQKHVKFEAQKAVKMPVDSEIYTNSSELNITDLNYYNDKNKLFSISVPNTRGLVLVDLNDIKKIYLERIDLDPDWDSNPEGAKTANILCNNDYSIIILGGNHSLWTHKYTRYQTKIQKCSNMLGKYSRHSFGICSISESVYIVSGCDGDETIGNCERYNSKNDEWKSLGKCIKPVRNCSICVFNNSAIYRFGGQTHDGQLCQDIERYDITTNKWTNIQYSIEPDIQSKVQILSNSLCSQINETQILVFGGEKGTIDPQIQSRQSFILNISLQQGLHTISGLNRYAILPDSTPLFNSQYSIQDHQLIFLQLKNKPNAAKIISFAQPAGIKILRADLKW